jgi:hypothetical protein
MKDGGARAATVDFDCLRHDVVPRDLRHELEFDSSAISLDRLPIEAGDHILDEAVEQPALAHRVGRFERPAGRTELLGQRQSQASQRAALVGGAAWGSSFVDASNVGSLIDTPWKPGTGRPPGP